MVNSANLPNFVGDLTLRLDRYLNEQWEDPETRPIRLEYSGGMIALSGRGLYYRELTSLNPLQPWLMLELKRLNLRASSVGAAYLGEKLFEILMANDKALGITTEGFGMYHHRWFLSGAMGGLPPSAYDYISVALKVLIHSGTLSAVLAGVLGGFVGVAISGEQGIRAFLTGAAAAELALTISYLASLPNSTKSEPPDGAGLVTELRDARATLDRGLLNLNCISEALVTLLGQLSRDEDLEYPLELRIILALHKRGATESELSDLVATENRKAVAGALNRMEGLGLIRRSDTRGTSSNKYYLRYKGLSAVRSFLIFCECQRAVRDGRTRWVCQEKVAFSSPIYSVSDVRSLKSEFRTSKILIEVDHPGGVGKKRSKRQITLRSIWHVGPYSGGGQSASWPGVGRRSRL